MKSSLTHRWVAASLLGYTPRFVGLPRQWIDVVVQPIFFILGFPVGIIVLVPVLFIKRHRVAFRDPQGNLNRVRKGDPQAEEMLVITGPTAVMGAMEPVIRVDRFTGAFKRFPTIDAPIDCLFVHDQPTIVASGCTGQGSFSWVCHCPECESALQSR